MGRKIMLCCFDRVEMGGGTTYFYRMVRWLSERGGRTIALVSEGSSVSENAGRMFREAGVEIVRFRYTVLGIRAEQRLKDYLTEDAEILNLQLSFENLYLSADLLRSLGLRSVRSVFYALFWGDVSPRLSLNVRLTRGFLRKLSLSGSFAVMDEIMRDIAANTYGLSRERIPIIELGLRTEGVEEGRERKRREGCFVISSLCRMDFPFKGYVLGLLSDFSELARVYPDMKLKIAGDGPGLPRLREEREKLSQDIRERVELLGELPYEELTPLIRESDVYVGMGTSMLDFVREGVLCINASAYQTENYSAGFFGEVNCLGGPVEGRFSEKVSEPERYRAFRFQELIRRVYQMPEAEYREKSQKALELYRTVYSIDHAMERLFAMPGAYRGSCGALTRTAMHALYLWHSFTIKRKEREECRS
ncbi:glycosyltransferase family 4 protein [Oribacterium sp. oral taxon 078]|uniref:glycosyltransferase family 4 protein n=1 Tax=Oribacterium sp. oral taxon 078 TaxID=652706 RepID=UPI00055C4B57|nr:glycosyltransferase family 4 protein [Oribacterium sp. oral taxon 078]